MLDSPFIEESYRLYGITLEAIGAEQWVKSWGTISVKYWYSDDTVRLQIDPNICSLHYWGPPSKDVHKKEQYEPLLNFNFVAKKKRARR